MIKWLIGLNGAGKTVVLEEILDQEIEDDKKIVTNIRKVQYKGFDIRKLDALEESEFYEEIFDYGELKVMHNQVTVLHSDYNYTEQFMDILTLICREGDTLILDEPEFGLFGMEIDMLAKIFQILLPFYKDGYVATHCQELLAAQPSDFYLCQNYQLKEITEDELYEYIGQF